MNVPNGYDIVRVEPRSLPDAELAAAARLRQASQRECVPEDPPMPLEPIMQRIRADAPGHWQASFVAREASGALAGYGLADRALNEPENAHMRWLELSVLPAHRRRGLGRALVAALATACLGQGDDLVFMAQTLDRVPAGERFARAIAATPGLAMKTTQLALAGVDRAKVSAWAKLDPPGYRLERADATVPPRLVKPYLDAMNAMNDMPKGELRFADQEFTAQQLRDREAWLREAGMAWWSLVAIHEATGEGVGFTEVQYDPRFAHVIHQGGTGVTPKHRGRRIGLWMKAVMLERILRERSDAKFIRTGNANANAPMLAINAALGFRPAWSATLWQLPLAAARTSLGLRERTTRSA